MKKFINIKKNDVTPHKNFSRLTADCDIAIITLKEPVDSELKTEPVTLNTETNLDGNKTKYIFIRQKKNFKIFF